MAEGAPRTTKVLVVDDDPDTVESFAMLVRALGAEAFVATNPRDVLEVAKRVRPHVIFLDIGMPEMDGWDVARQLRKDLGYDEVKLVAVTGFDGPQDRHRSREAGFDAHMAKPLDVDLVQIILEQLL